jgi:nitrate/nitrite transport system substrate-binding protein
MQETSMSSFDDPYHPANHGDRGCSCGGHASQAEHDAPKAGVPAPAIASDDLEALARRSIENAVVRALFPHAGTRRRFLSAVGSSTAAGAITSLVPIGALTAMAQDKGRGGLEKKALTIGYIPITCATPLIMAHPLRFYEREGLRVEVVRTAGWAMIRDKVLNREYDASHMLAPMPLSISLGLGSTAMPMNVATIQNINGQAITLSIKHRERRDPKTWQGFRFAVPFEFSIHNFLLRYYVAEHGLDPDRDIQIRVLPPPEMVANLRAGNIDGFLGPDPFNQRAVFDGAGFIHILSRELWDGHPCCAFGVPAAFIKENPNTFAALFRAVLRAAAMAREAKHRPLIAHTIAPAAYLNQPVEVIEQVLLGRFADGLGKVREEPNRIDFDPFPWPSMAVWILTQMRRWGYIKQDMNWREIAERVFLAADARKRMAEIEIAAPKENFRRFRVMGREFDPMQADAYLKGFAIRRA